MKTFALLSLLGLISAEAASNISAETSQALSKLDMETLQKQIMQQVSE